MKRADTSRLHKKKLKAKPIRSQADFDGFLTSGGRLRKTLPATESDVCLWVDAATDRTVSRTLCEKALAAGAIRGLGDGMFGEHQTYERAA